METFPRSTRNLPIGFFCVNGALLEWFFRAYHLGANAVQNLFFKRLGLTEPEPWRSCRSPSGDPRAGLRWSTFDAALFVDNIADTHPIVSREQDNIAVGSYHDITTRPRTFGLTVTYRH